MTSPPADLRSADFRKILLIKLSAVGDVAHTIPVLNKLRRRYPTARLDWLATPAIAELLQHNPAISNVVEFVRHEWSTPWRLAPIAGYARLAARLRAVGYDLVVDMHGQFRTALLTLATGAPVRIGFDRPRAEVWDASPRKFPAHARKHAWQGAREGSWLAYTHHIPVPTLDLHAVDRYLNLGPILGLDQDAADFSFPIPRTADIRIDALLDYYGIAKAKLMVMAPGTIWETKRWQSEGFAEVARHFSQKGFAVTLIGSERERAVCAEVASLAPGTVNLAGETTLSELAALLRHSTICVSNDSGAMHLAVALDRPVVSIFGPTDAIWVGPYRRADAVLQAELPCSPCYLRQLSRCPHAHACMREISAGAVIARIESILGERAGGVRPAGAQARRR
ncbi:MAG TPA: glycosyltransferase family 9 protein [Xanthobacteraceae bacterium]|nr:glycosyltransferase family 9 protein [Xanthobacteraceae bacterium]